jgi:hypothetical protein
MCKAFGSIPSTGEKKSMRQKAGENKEGPGGR